MADLTIVTNKYLAEMAENINGKAFVLPDKLPALQPSKQLQLKDGFNIFLISSFNKDEPVIEVINAAYRLQDENVNVYVSGNYTKLEEQVRNSISDNVVFTGFVSDDDFVNYLYSSDAIIVLTKVDYCMLCGCYEAVSASKPLITSNKQVLQEYFYNAIFINNNENDIVNAVIYLKNNYNEQVDKISELKKALSASWRDKKLQLEHIIKEMEAG
jgi:glycosyltransferase involved in cell wall biosynthesis